MKSKFYRLWTLALALVVVGAGIAFATWTFNPDTGTGFVGKGDVQLLFGWNNAQLQANAGSVQFRASSEVVTEVTWECTNANNDRIQERERTTTTTTQGVVSSTARVRNQITGFNLTGYSGTPTESSTTGGPAVNSCPAGPWVLTTPAGDPVVVSESTELEVSTDGINWVPLPPPPA